MRVAAAARKAWTAAFGLGLPVGFGLWTRLLGAELPAPGFTPESRGEHALRGVLAHVRPGTPRKRGAPEVIDRAARPDPESDPSSDPASLPEVLAASGFPPRVR